MILPRPTSLFPCSMPDGLRAGATAAVLPRWDLSDLYEAPDSPRVAADLDRAEADAKRFSERYAGRLGQLDGAGLAAAIAECERIDEGLGALIDW